MVQLTKAVGSTANPMVSERTRMSTEANLRENTKTAIKMEEAFSHGLMAQNMRENL